jgi:hypothetical protein
MTTLPDDLMFLLQCIFSSLDLAPARSNIFPAYSFQEERKNLFFRFGYNKLFFFFSFSDNMLSLS